MVLVVSLGISTYPWVVCILEIQLSVCVSLFSLTTLSVTCELLTDGTTQGFNEAFFVSRCCECYSKSKH